MAYFKYRCQLERSANCTQAGVKTKYINDAAPGLVQVLMETDNTGIVQATYTHGYDLIAMNRAGANSYYHFDGLGSVVALSDYYGNLVERYSYDVFGEPKNLPAEGILPISANQHITSTRRTSFGKPISILRMSSCTVAQ